MSVFLITSILAALMIGNDMDWYLLSPIVYLRGGKVSMDITV